MCISGKSSDVFTSSHGKTVDMQLTANGRFPLSNNNLSNPSHSVPQKSKSFQINDFSHGLNQKFEDVPQSFKLPASNSDLNGHSTSISSEVSI